MKKDSLKQTKAEIILNKAEELFLSEGYQPVSMDRIALESGVTKQTVYRYYSSKEELFKQVIDHLSQASHSDYLEALDIEDQEEALRQFSFQFIQQHLSEKHLSIMRLIISESASRPELVNSFFPSGPGTLEVKLQHFFQTKLNIQNRSFLPSMLTGMLLSFRNRALIGKDIPEEQEIRDFVNDAVQLFISLVPVN